MPRSGSGAYTLPAGNPVVAGTTIEANWANTTLNDVATELTGSLARSGAGGMTGPLRLDVGSSGVPALAFSAETTTGLYRAGTNDVRFAVATVDVQQWTASGTAITGTASVSSNVTVGGTLAVTGTTTLTGAATLTANPTLSAGTANGVLYLNGGKVATSGSALTFDGTNVSTTGTASATKLIPTGGTATGNGMYLPAANTLGFSTNGVLNMSLDASGNLGVGTASPSVKLDVQGGAINSSSWVSIISGVVTNNALFRATNTGGTLFSGLDNSAGGVTGTGYAGALWHTGAYPIAFGTNNALRMTLDASGNLGLGVTPKVWNAAFKALEAGTAGNGIAAFAGGTPGTIITANAYYDSVGWKYGVGGPAVNLDTSSGYFRFNIAPSGTAGNAITFTQAMTLDANGNLYGTAGTTSMTNGFFYIPGAAGVPSGTPTAVANRFPAYVDTTNNRLYIHNGTSWRYASLI